MSNQFDLPTGLEVFYIRVEAEERVLALAGMGAVMKSSGSLPSIFRPHQAESRSSCQRDFWSSCWHSSR